MSKEYSELVVEGTAGSEINHVISRLNGRQNVAAVFETLIVPYDATAYKVEVIGMTRGKVMVILEEEGFNEVPKGGIADQIAGIDMGFDPFFGEPV